MVHLRTKLNIDMVTFEIYPNRLPIARTNNRQSIDGVHYDRKILNEDVN